MSCSVLAFTNFVLNVPYSQLSHVFIVFLLGSVVDVAADDVDGGIEDDDEGIDDDEDDDEGIDDDEDDE